MNRKRTIKKYIVATGLLIALILAGLFVKHLNARPSLLVSSDRPGVQLQINEKTYEVGEDKKKIILDSGVYQYQATLKDSTSFTGTINTSNDPHQELILTFTTFDKETIIKQTCSGDHVTAGYCGKSVSTLSVEFVANNSWALITDQPGYSEAVKLTDDGWRHVQISQSDINSGQYPNGLEKAAREYE